jgi:archaellum component FlaC
MLCEMNPSLKNNGHPRITLRMIFDHVLALGQRMGGVEQRLGNVEQQLGNVEQGVTRLERKVDIISTQISMLDSRLDDIEVVQLPKIRKAVGMR